MLELPNSEYVVISKTEDDAIYFLNTRLIPKLENLPQIEGIRWPTIVKKTSERIILSNGSSCTSLPAAASSGAGRTLNGFVLDEFGGVDKQPNCKGSQLYKNIKPTIEKSKGWAMVIGTSEPGSFFNAQLYKQWKGETPPLYYFLSWMTDPARTEEWYRREMATCETEADFQNQFPRDMGEFFATREGKVFPSFDHEIGGRHVRYFEPNWNLQYMTAYDHGFRHYAANLHALYDPRSDMLYIVSDQFWKGVDVPPIAQEINEREKLYGERPRVRLADGQIFNKDGRKSVADHFKDAGLTFRPAYKADEAGSRALLSSRFYANKILIHPDCKKTIEQLMNYTWKVNAISETPVDKDDEAPDCLRWLCAHVHKQPDRPEEIVSVKGRKEYASKRQRLYDPNGKIVRSWQAM
jgi:hypothetical protein